MWNTVIRSSICVPLGLACVMCWAIALPVDAEQVLFSFDQDSCLDSVEARDTDVELVDHDGVKSLHLTTGHQQQWPGITLKAPRGRWDLSRCEYVAVDVKNVAEDRVEVSLRVDSVAPDGKRVFHQAGTNLEPGLTTTLKLTIKRRLPVDLAPKLFGMRGYPGGLSEDGIDAANVDQLLVFVSRPSKNHSFEIDNVRSGGTYDPPQWLSSRPDQFFPMIDKYGQFIHKDWPGKTHSDDDLTRRIKEEAADFDTHPGPDGWNRYGGWQDGPQLEATGHFRTEKHRGKWWLVDPEGRLFWSHGTDCVRGSSGYTPITDREFYFAELPPEDSPFGQFYRRGSWAPHGYYQDKGSYQQYNLTGANLLRKYGDDWAARFAELCHRRLRSWGMNTIGNWSDSSICLMQKTPYTATVGSGLKPLEGSSGYWGKFPDVFDPEFKAALRRNTNRERGRTANDPWCIGYFVDNELSWGDELSLALATLSSPPGQAAKRVFVDELEAKYGSIEKLNRVWGTEHQSWDALLESRDPPEKEKARDDLAAFYSKTAKQYFLACREVIKEIAPDKLYLGCRFAWVNDRAIRAAELCDVISFNRYQYSVSDLDLPQGVDKPVIIGEFHFGALDRGMFHTGLKPVANQNERAKTYADYVRGALENRWIVGTHWFQYGDQATTGRGDGENYQIGFLDICDTPYPEIVRASRTTGASLYRVRLEE